MFSVSNVEQVEKCWEEYLELGDILRLSCCELDEGNLQFLLNAFNNNNNANHHPQNHSLEYKPIDLEFDLCTFPTNDNDDRILQLLAELLQKLPLQTVEIENRLLETPWNSSITGVFLERGNLDRLDKLELYGLDLTEIGGKGFPSLLGAKNCRLRELVIGSCTLDTRVMEQLGRALSSNDSIQSLALMEDGIDSDMLHAWLRHYVPIRGRSLKKLNLARNRLTYPALEHVTSFLNCQSQLEFLSLSHNSFLFKNYSMDAPNGDTLFLNRFWKTLHQHLSLLYFWAFDPADPALEERAKPILQRNLWFKVLCRDKHNFPLVIWPRILQTCSPEPSVVLEFLKLHMEQWMTYRFRTLQNNPTSANPYHRGKIKHE